MVFALSPERDTHVDQLLTRYPDSRAALLPVLWECQRQHGWISPDVIDFVSQKLGLSTAVVKGVVTFYTMFFEQPVGQNVVWVCRTLSCDLRGGKAIQEHLESKLGCPVGQTTPDGKFTILKAECLAACGQAPMVQINDRYYENLDFDKLDAIIDAHRNEGAQAAAQKFASHAAFDVPAERLISNIPPPSPEAVAAASSSDPSSESKVD